MKTVLFLLATTSIALAGPGPVVTLADPSVLSSTPRVTPLDGASITMDLEKLIRVQRAPGCAYYVSDHPVAILNLEQASPQLHVALHGAGMLVKPQGQFTFWTACADRDGWAELGKVPEGWPAGRYEVYAASHARSTDTHPLELAISDPEHVTPEEAAAVEARKRAEEEARKPKPEFADVVTQFPDVTEADAFDLTKVKAAIEKATPEMWYSLGSCPHNIAYVPVPASGEPGQDPDWIGIDDHAGTEDHPYAEVWTVEGELRLDVRMPKLAPGTPVLVWNEDPARGAAVLVTADGGRYRLDATPYSGGIHKYTCGSTPMLTPGIHTPFPPPLQSVVLTSKMIAVLEASGSLPAGLSKKIEAARASGSACTDHLWKSRFDARDKANQVANITQLTRENRRQQILDDYNAAVPKVCAAAKRSFDQAFEAGIDAYKKRRRDLYQAVLPTVQALAR